MVKRKLRGLGNSIHPENLDVSLFDYISWVPAELAFEYTKRLYSEKSFIHGANKWSDIFSWEIFLRYPFCKRK